jgi:hypothetical protein
MDFAKGVCQQCCHRRAEAKRMKVNVEIECTPEEARQFLGLPDVSKVNQAYADAALKAMQGVGSFEQLQEYAKQLAPMGQMGMKLFEQLVASGAAMAAGGKKDG